MSSSSRPSKRSRRHQRRTNKDTGTPSYSEHLAARRNKHADRSDALDAEVFHTPQSPPMDLADLSHHTSISVDPSTLMHGLAGGGLESLRSESTGVLVWMEFIWLWGVLALLLGALPALLSALLANFFKWSLPEVIFGPMILLPLVLFVGWKGAEAWEKRRMLGAWGGRKASDHFRHAREDVLLQAIARNDLRFSTGLDGDLDVLWSPKGWTLLCPLTRARVPAEMTLASPIDRPWSATIRVSAVSHSNLWQAMEWPDGVTPSIQSTDQGAQLTITLVDHEDIRRRYLNASSQEERARLQVDMDQQSDLWAQVWTTAIRPLLSLDTITSKGAQLSRWGHLHTRASVEDVAGTYTTQTQDTSLHVYWDQGLALAHLLSNQSERRGSRFSRGVVWSLTGLFVAVMGLFVASGVTFWPMWWMIFAVLLATSFHLMSKQRTTSLLPDDVMKPRSWQANGLSLDDGVLSLGGECVDLKEPFGCTCSKTLANQDGQAFLSVEISGTLDGRRGRVWFRVPVGDRRALEGLQRLESTAPVVSGEAFDAWLWPALQAYGSVHGTVLREPVVQGDEFESEDEVVLVPAVQRV